MIKEELELLGACIGSQIKYGHLTQLQALDAITEANWLAWYLVMTGYENQLDLKYRNGLEEMSLKQKATRIANRVSQLDKCILDELKSILRV